MKRHSLLEQKNLYGTQLWLEDEICKNKRLGQVGIQLLSEINARLLNGVRSGPYRGGIFRTYDISVRDTRFSTTTHYTNIRESLHSFLNSFYSVNFGKISVIHRAAIIASNICRIHPFVDGNGRTSRLASLVLLLNEGYLYRGKKTLEDFIDDNSFSWNRGIKFGIYDHYKEMIEFYHKMVSSLMYKTSPNKLLYT